MSDSSPSKPKWASRMNTALRRSSTLLAISRPSTPSNPGNDKESDNRSLRKSGSGSSLRSTPATAVPANISTPSPIAESPAREAAALQDALGPSPLAQPSESTEDQPVAIAVEDTAEDQTSPIGYVPPPVLDSTVGNPGAFTDDPDILPHPETVVDPYAAPPAEETIEAITAEPEPIFAPVLAESMKSAESTSGAPAPETTEPISQDQSVSAPGFSTAVMPNFPLPSYNIWSGSNPDVDKALLAMPVAFTPSHHSQDSNIRAPEPQHIGLFKDPFGEPLVVIPDNAQMPEPHNQPPPDHHEGDHQPILMPLPAFNDVVEHQARHDSYTQNLAANNVVADPETDERIPLLSRSAPQSYSHHEQPTSHTLVGSSGSAYANGNGNIHTHLSELGWVEYNLPDGTTYYSHLNRRLTTDLDLRSERVLRAVTVWVEERENETVNVDVEGWLVESNDKAVKSKKKSSGWGRSKKEEEPVYLERWWVDHQQRSVTKGISVAIGEHTGRNHAHTDGHKHGKGKKQAAHAKSIEEDHLDLEYRYWAFMESHPSHLTASPRAKGEALDVLTWALTDRILPSHRAIPAPFTQEECRELRTILFSFHSGNEATDNGIQTRIIARILLRVAHWRQVYFRPRKPLPKDVQFGGRSLSVHQHHHRPFRRAFFDFIISCVCLGIPYFFIERVRLGGRSSSDEESGLFRGPAPFFIVGACTCLMAALVLSASVTFLSLPGLDGFTRSASMVAILFAAFAVAATGVAVLRHKADLERPISHVGIEGIVGISRRTIALSLPLVFLAYAIIAFVVGLTLYSFRGKSIEVPLPKSPFEDYTRWIVVGVLGGLAGILTTSFLLLRR